MERKRTERLLREHACKLGEAANEWQHKFEEMRTERDALAVRCERLRVALKGIDPMFDNDSPLLTAYKREIEAVRAEGGWK